MNKGFLFATSSRKIKSHVMEISHCLAMFITYRKTKHNHIIFNDSISKFYRCSIRGLCRGISMFISICLRKKKKNAEAIKFLIIKKHVFKNKMYFCLKKKSNVLLNKKVIFIFQHDFQTLFRNAEHLLYYPQMFVFSFHTFFVLLYQFLRNRT